MDDSQLEDVALETPPQDVFIAPSIHHEAILAGTSYTHHTPIPDSVAKDIDTECVLGIDEAGRGPTLGTVFITDSSISSKPSLGPMVYGLFYLPLSQHTSLLSEIHHFDDSKVLTPQVRSSLMEVLCNSSSDLYWSCGWATRVMSARDISSGMFRPGMYNLNAQAMDATIELIKDVFAKGVNVKEVYIDTIGKPETYQKKLERIFPTTKITVAKKADSLYPCVSAASVCAKVTRDAALDLCWQAYSGASGEDAGAEHVAEGWGSGYPGDARSTAWLRENMDPVFGWGNECRFSWATAKDMLEAKGDGIRVEWPLPDDPDIGMRLMDFSTGTCSDERTSPDNELASWFGRPAAESVF